MNSIQYNTRNTRILQGIAMIFCLCINMLGANTNLFSGTLSSVSGVYPTPVTPAPFTFSIWFLIFAQWIYDYIWNKRGIGVLDYLLNAGWVILFCNNYIVLSYCVLILMTIRMIANKKHFITYTTWLCIACSIQGYLVGGPILFFFTVFAITIMANPLGNIVKAIDESRAASWNNENVIIPLIPVITSTSVVIWAIIGIIAK